MADPGESTAEVNYFNMNPPGTEFDYFRNRPFEQIIYYDFDYDATTGDRKIAGATIDDRLYGRFEFDGSDPGDAAIIEIINSDAFRRLDWIEQLVLPKEFATKPETTDFTRYEHSMGVMLLIRMLGGDAKQQIRGLVHDLAQTAFSHLGDWRKQGMSSAEDHHDQILAEYMRSWGIDEILEHYGLTVEEVTDKSIQDIVEREAPALCADRVDYTLREVARGSSASDVPYLLSQLAVVDETIALKTKRAAQVFAKDYHDLALRHWGEEGHSIKEKLLLLMIERGHEAGIITEEDMYGVDPMLMVKLEMANDPIINELWWILERKGIERKLNLGPADAFSENHLKSEQTTLFVPLVPFKTRVVDPDYIDTDGRVVKLSETDAEFKEWLDEYLQGGKDRYGFDIGRKFDVPWSAFGLLTVEPDVKLVLSGHADLL